MKELRLAAMALLIVVVAPIALGWAWPTGTETVDVWTTENPVDITPSIATSDIPIVDSYSGPMNHYWIYDNGYSSYDPVAYTNSPSAIPRLSYTATTETITSDPHTIVLEHYPGYRTDFVTAVNMTVIMKDYTVHSCATVVYMPGANSLYLIGTGYTGQVLKVSDVRSVSVQGASSMNPVLLTVRTYEQTGEYVDMSQGFELDASLSPYYLDWFNGMSNHAVEMWIRTASIAENSTISGGGASVELELNGGEIMANGRLLGSATAYPYISVVLDHEAGSIEVRGLIGASSFTDATWSVGNVLKSYTSVAAMDKLRLTGHFEYEIKRTYSEIGTGKGISDAAIIPYSYYPHYSWQVSFDSPARFGERIVIGSNSFPVMEGGITFEDMQGEEHTVPIRGMAILSLVYDDGPQEEIMQHIYINGFELEASTPSSDYPVTLLGNWYVSVTVHDVSQGEQTNYVWDVGSFGLDKEGYCMVGLLCSVMIMIGAGLWGRMSGTKLMIVIFTMGVCAAAYLILM